MPTKAKPNELKFLRARRDLSQYDAAAAVGISVNRFWRIEHGYTSPTDAEVEAIVKFFGVRRRTIFEDEAAA